MDLIFLDTETTGNEIGKDRLCQICYQCGSNVKYSYFKPPIPISVKAASITHITDAMVADKEPFAGSAMYSELQTLLTSGILVAHNARFDIGMLEAEGLSVPRFICTLRVARFLDAEHIIPEYGLQYLRYFLHLDVDGDSHDAQADVRVLHALYQRLFQKMAEQYGNEPAVIEKMMEISATPTLFAQFNFGKYKGQKVADVAMTDRPYLMWLLNSKRENESNNEDWIYTLEHYLGG